MSYQIQIPGRIHSGNGSVSRLADIFSRDGVKKALLFTDKGVLSTGIAKSVFDVAASSGVELEVFDGVIAEPSTHDVDRVMQAARSAKADMLIALGGGSVMDTAKLASVLIGATYTVYDLVKDPSLARKTMRAVMIPTTCGTGSEATCNAIVAIPEESTKKGIVNPALIPDEVILDVGMIARLPKAIVAATAVDALAHVVECYTSKKATPLSDTYAIAGARLIFRNIEKAYANGDDLEAKEALLLGAFYGGVAITGSGTTAVHALSYPLGGKYHIAHGVSNAILFAPVMAVNKDSCRERLAELCDAVYPELAISSAETRATHVINRIADIVKNTEIPTSLAKYGITDKDLDFLVEAGSQQQRLLVNNRKELSLDDIRGIYRKVI